MKPTPIQVFAAYFLGIGTDWKYRFFNHNALARHFGLDPSVMTDLLQEYRLTPEFTRHVDYNLASAHATAQGLAEDGTEPEVRAFVERTWAEFQAALGTFDPGRDFENVDYDDIWKDGNKA